MIPRIRYWAVLLGATVWMLPLALGQGEPAREEDEAKAQDAASEISNLEFISFRNDIRLFTVMAAINAGGFDYEVPGKEMSDVRRSIRLELQGVNSRLRSRLNEFYLSHHSPGDPSAQSVYTSLALLIEGPPEFKVRDNLPRVPPEVSAIMGFEGFLPDFYREARIGELWQKYSGEYEKVLKAYRPIAENVIRGTLKYFRVPTRVVLDRQIYLIPDLLNYKNVVNARNQERVYLLVVGPTESPGSNFTQLQHEYLHFLVDPLMEKNGGVLLRSRKLLDMAHEQPNLRADFKDNFLLIVGESLVEAVQMRLQPPEEPEKRQVELFRRGLIFYPYFYRSLEQFETQEEISLPAYLRMILERLKTSTIEEDEASVRRLEAQIHAREAEQRKVAEEEARQRELITQRKRMLVDAGKLLAAGKYTEAEALLRDLVAQEPENGNAYFYLGQIEHQQQRYDDAFTSYQKAESSAQVQEWVRAWARVRMGRYLAHQEKFQEARELFEAVVRTEGDLQGAKEEALDLIGKLPHNESN